MFYILNNNYDGDSVGVVQDTTSDTSRERPGSRSGSEMSKESEDPSLRYGHAGIARLADRLRRNWTTTKTDIGQTISRIKKKSTASVADLSEVFRPPSLRRDTSVEKVTCPAETSNGDQQQQQREPSPPLPPPHPSGRQSVAGVGESSKKKATWALRHIRRRMTVAPIGSGKKEASTFFVTLTLEQPNTSPE